MLGSGRLAQSKPRRRVALTSGSDRACGARQAGLFTGQPRAGCNNRSGKHPRGWRDAWRTSTVRWRQQSRWQAERRRICLCRLRAGTGRGAARPMMRRALNFSAAWRSRTGMPLVWWSRLAGFPGRAPHQRLRSARRRRCAFGLPHKFRHYFYGASPEATQRLINRLLERHPGLCVAGHRSPPRCVLSPRRRTLPISLRSTKLNQISSGWGLGMPKQEEMDGRGLPHLGKIQGDSAHRRRHERLPLPRGRETTGSGLDAASGAGMVVPLTDRAAPICSPLPARQLAFHRPPMLQQATGL